MIASPLHVNTPPLSAITKKVIIKAINITPIMIEEIVTILAYVTIPLKLIILATNATNKNIMPVTAKAMPK